LELDDVADPVPGPGSLAVRVHAAALNLNDTDMCRGRYPTINPPLPFPLGMEVAGVVDEAGPCLEGWVGRRVVAVPEGGHGGYAESFVDVVLDATGGRGADVICDLVGGDVATRSFACIAREGRYLIAGFSGGIELGETGIAPRPIAWGNFDVLGVMMSWSTT